MSSVLHVNDQNFDAEVLKSAIPVLVDFHATWCGPCKQLKPILEQMAKDYAGKVKFAAIDIDEAPSTASGFGIMAVPTMILFKDGREQRKMTGFKNRPDLDTAVKAVL